MSASAETDRRNLDGQHFGASGERELALALQEQLHRSGKAWVSVAPVEKEHVLRCSPTQILVVCSDMFGVTTETNGVTDVCSPTRNSRSNTVKLCSIRWTHLSVHC